jgi:hypothetical protein
MPFLRNQPYFLQLPDLINFLYLYINENNSS